MISLSKDRENFMQIIGDFNKNDKPLKLLARQGQSMSTTTHIQRFVRAEFDDIPDVERNEHVFSDGSGFISREIMAKVAKKFDLEQVSAIQIRFAGYKGVLV